MSEELPPQSPDLSPCDLFVETTERKADVHNPHSLEELSRKILGMIFPLFLFSSFTMHLEAYSVMMCSTLRSRAN
jgi:hypothetical protein